MMIEYLEFQYRYSRWIQNLFSFEVTVHFDTIHTHINNTNRYIKMTKLQNEYGFFFRIFSESTAMLNPDNFSPGGIVNIVREGFRNFCAIFNIYKVILFSNLSFICMWRYTLGELLNFGTILWISKIESQWAAWKWKTEWKYLNLIEQ